MKRKRQQISGKLGLIMKFNTDLNCKLCKLKEAVQECTSGNKEQFNYDVIQFYFKLE